MLNRGRSSGDSRITDNPYLIMSILLILWGSFAAIGKLTLNNIDSYQLQFYMFGSAALVMTIILIASGNINKLKGIPLKGYITLALYSIPFHHSLIIFFIS